MGSVPVNLAKDPDEWTKRNYDSAYAPADAPPSLYPCCKCGTTARADYFDPAWRAPIAYTWQGEFRAGDWWCPSCWISIGRATAGPPDAWRKLLSEAKGVIEWKCDELFTDCPNPSVTQRQQWFKLFREAYQGISDEFILQETRQVLGRYFNLTDAQLQHQLTALHPTRQAEEAPAPASEPISLLIERELLRRIYINPADREWLRGNWEKFGNWTDGQLLAITTRLFAGETLDVDPLLASLHFIEPLPETTGYLAATLHNLGLAARRTELAKEYAQTKDASLLRQIGNLKPLNPEHWA